MEKHLQEAEQAYQEVCDIIRDSLEHGQFNHMYFEEPFKLWYAKKFDKLEENNMNNEISNCCNAPIVTVHGDEGTSYYKCTKCGKGCDPNNADQEFQRIFGRFERAEKEINNVS